MAQQFRFIKMRHHRQASVVLTLGSMTYFLQQNQHKSTTKSEATPTNTKSTQGHEDNADKQSSSKSHAGMIKTDLTDKLASKPYLNYHNPYGRHGIITSTINTGKKLWGRFAQNDTNAVVTNDSLNWAEEKASTKRSERPKGVPRRIRILAIDVPEFREVFDGECRVNLSRVYPDGISPSKYISRKVHANEESDDGDKKKEKSKLATKKESEKIEIVQKSLARSLVRCRNVQSKRIGVELLEASVYDLNPSNMRRTYHFGKYKYDPGKYGNSSRDNQTMIQRRMSVTPEGSRLNIRKRNKSHTTVTKSSEVTTTTANNDEKGLADVDESVEDDGVQEPTDGVTEVTILAEEEDEVDAPWHQSAWIEEIQIRINGSIPFGSNVERSSWVSRKLFGNCYRQTVKPSRSFLQWFVPSFLSGEKVGGEDGIDGDYGRDGRTINRASSKPHAVIADGSAMQRVPGSLRYLTKCCKEADVPLFIINDPRVWGGNTNKDLESAARDIRKTIKARIVSNALTIKEGSMFERGRMLGKLESETKWQMKDAGRRTRQAVTDAAARLQKERDENWSNLDRKDLLKKLVEKKIVSIEGSNIMDASTTQAFEEICIEYLKQLKESRKANTNLDQSEVQDQEIVSKQLESTSSATEETDEPSQK